MNVSQVRLTQQEIITAFIKRLKLLHTYVYHEPDPTKKSAGYHSCFFSIPSRTSPDGIETIKIAIYESLEHPGHLNFSFLGETWGAQATFTDNILTPWENITSSLFTPMFRRILLEDDVEEHI